MYNNTIDNNSIMIYVIQSFIRYHMMFNHMSFNCSIKEHMRCLYLFIHIC